MKTICCLLIAIPGFLFGQELSLQFETNEYAITQEHRTSVKAMLRGSAPDNSKHWVVRGHTDQVGSETSNLELSEKRMASVVDLLKSENVPVTGMYYGESQLLKQASTNVNAVNRRVEISFEPIPEQDRIPVWMETSRVPDQEFTIEQKNDTVVVGKEGTRIEFPKQAFTDLNGNLITEPVKIELKECYTTEAIFNAGLTTKSSDALLETGGMIYIEATSNGNPVKMKDGATYNLSFSGGENKAGMETFYGKKQSDGRIDWAQGPTVAERIPLGSVSEYFENSTFDIEVKFKTYKTVLVCDTVMNGKEYRIWRNYSGGRQWLDTIEVNFTGQQRSMAYLQKLANEKAGKSTGLLQSSRFGWINCDRFYNDRRPKKKLYVRVSGKAHPVVTAAFSNINSFMYGVYINENTIQFTGIPKGERIVLLALSKDGVNGPIKFAKKPMVVNRDVRVDLEMSLVQEEVVENALAEL